MTDAIHTRVKQMVADHFGVTTDVLTPETDFFANLDGDDIDRLDLCCQVETEFRVEIDDNDLEECGTVGGLIDVLRRRLPHAAAE